MEQDTRNLETEWKCLRHVRPRQRIESEYVHQVAVFLSIVYEDLNNNFSGFKTLIPLFLAIKIEHIYFDLKSTTCTIRHIYMATWAYIFKTISKLNKLHNEFLI